MFCLAAALILLLLFSTKIKISCARNTSRAPKGFDFLIEGKRFNEMQQVKDSQQIAFSVQFKDADGQVAAGALDASPAPAWGIDDPSFGSVQAAADGQSAVFVPNGKKLGTVHVLFTGSMGGKQFSGQSEDIVVVAGDAVAIAILAGAVSDQAPAAPPVAPAP